MIKTFLRHTLMECCINILFDKIFGNFIKPKFNVRELIILSLRKRKVSIRKLLKLGDATQDLGFRVIFESILRDNNVMPEDLTEWRKEWSVIESEDFGVHAGAYTDVQNIFHT